MCFLTTYSFHWCVNEPIDTTLGSVPPRNWTYIHFFSRGRDQRFTSIKCSFGDRNSSAVPGCLCITPRNAVHGEQGSPEPRAAAGVTQCIWTWPGAARRAGWHPHHVSILHSLSPKIDSKEVSQSNFLLLGFVVLQASNCRQARETQRTSLSYPFVIFGHVEAEMPSPTPRAHYRIGFHRPPQSAGEPRPGNPAPLSPPAARTPLTPQPAVREDFFSSSPQGLSPGTPLLSQQRCRLQTLLSGRVHAEIFSPERQGWQRSTDKLLLAH